MTSQSTGVSGSLRVVFGVVKGICILLGLPITVLCLMATIGAFTENGWIRLIPAAVVALGLPLLIVDRLLPEDSGDRSRGLPTDVLAMIWVVVPLVFVGVVHGTTGKLLAVEADRLGASGMKRVAQVTYWLARVDPVSGAEQPATKEPADKAAAAEGPRDAGVKKPDAATATAKKGKDGGAGDAAKAQVKYTPAELFRKWAPTVVSISADTKRGRGGGTGFIIDEQGTIATNAHVIHGATALKVKLKDGKWINKVELLVENEEADLALLRIDTPRLPPPVVMGDSAKVTVGEKVVAIGNPLGLEHTLTDGLISSRRLYRGRKWIQISVPISPGNSGGPLFNMRGEVVGVTTAGFSMWSGAQNLNLAVPINILKKQIKAKYPDRKPVGSDKPQTW